MCELGNIRFVRYYDDGVAAGMQLIEERHDFITSLRIEVTGWLICQDDGGRVDQGSCDGNALALTTGHLVRLMVHACTQADRLHYLLGAFDAFRCRGAVVDQRQLDIVECGGAGQQVECLKDKPDLLVADARQFVVIELGDIMPI